MLTFMDDEVNAQIEADTGIRRPFARQAFPDVDADVRRSIVRVEASPSIPHENQVRGFVYTVDEGTLREVV